MTVLNGHYDGRQVVLDEPIPEGIPPDTPVRITFELDMREHPLEKIAKMAAPGEMPRDYAEQHEHYVKGAPRR